jgi:hypothetical protein
MYWGWPPRATSVLPCNKSPIWEIELDNFPYIPIYAVRGSGVNQHAVARGYTIFRTDLYPVSPVCGRLVALSSRPPSCQVCGYRPGDETANATDPSPPHPQIPTCGYYTSIEKARSCICSPVYLVFEVIAFSFAWRVCKMPAQAIFGSRGSWPSYPSGEYSSDQVVLIKWRFADLLIPLQLHCATLSFSCQHLLISRSFPRFTFLVISLSGPHSFTIDFFFTLALTTFHTLQ